MPLEEKYIPLYVSTVFAQSARLPDLSYSRAIQSIEDQIKGSHFQDFWPIEIPEDKAIEKLTKAMIIAQEHIYKSHLFQEKFIQNKRVDLDAASQDEEEQPYVIVYRLNKAKERELYFAYGCGSNGKTFNPNEGVANKLLIVKGQTHPLLTRECISKILAKILPERDENSAKKYKNYVVPYAEFNSKTYLTGHLSYIDEDIGYSYTPDVKQQTSPLLKDIFPPVTTTLARERYVYDDMPELEDVPSSTPRSK